MIHVGITGYNAAGKGEATDYLRDKGFISISLSDLLRDEARTRNLDLTRENLTRLGQELRKQLNPGFLAEKALFHINNQNNFVIDSIRHPDEVKILKQHLKPFLLIGVDAPIAVRFERSQLRGRNENAGTIEEFMQREQAEMKNNPNAQQLHRCMELCDVLILNDGSIEELEEKIEKAIVAYETTA